jgi:hypothetical protein
MHAHREATDTGMKKTFFILWALLSSFCVVGALIASWLEPSWMGAGLVLLAGYYSLCFFQFVRALCQPWGLLGPRRRAGYWFCLLLLPLALLPLHAAFEIWQQGGYSAERMGNFGILIGTPLLAWLQDLMGYLGPMLLLASLGLVFAVGLLRLLKTQVVR